MTRKKEAAPAPEEIRRRTAERLQLIDAAVWGIDHPRDVLDIALASASQEAAAAELMRRAPTSREGAEVILDGSVRRWIPMYAEKLREEQAELRRQLRGLDHGAG